MPARGHHYTSRPSKHAGVLTQLTWGGGVTILAKPNKMAALIMGFARETGRTRMAPEVIPWGPEQHPRLRWQLSKDDTYDLMRWLAQLPASWPSQRLFRAIRNAVLAPRGLAGCVCE